MVLTRYQVENGRSLTGEFLDKLIGMQEKNDKMMMELQIKRAWLEEN